MNYITSARAACFSFASLALVLSKVLDLTGLVLVPGARVKLVEFGAARNSLLLR